jgi:hypothetical protein
MSGHHFASLGWRLALALLLAGTAWLGLQGLTRLGPTYDEPADLTSGVVLWKAGEHFPETRRSAFPLMLESLWLRFHVGDGVALWPGYAEHDLDRLTSHLLHGDVFETKARADSFRQALWWARLPGLIATLLTALLLHAAARRLWHGEAPALLAAAAHCLAPSTLAHAARADGAALAGLGLLGAVVFGWRRLRGHGTSWPALLFALAALLVDWSMWILVPPIALILLIEGTGRIFRIAARAGVEPSSVLRHSFRGGVHSLDAARVALVRLIVGVVIFWLLMVELTGDWAIWIDLWQSAVAHWTAAPSVARPLFFHGTLYDSVPPLYHPTLLALKTPLWLVILWCLALARREVWGLSGVRQALVYLHLLLLWYVGVSLILVPPEGHRPFVPLVPLICLVAGGALRPRSLVQEFGRRALARRLIFVGGAIAVGGWTLIAVAPHWHAQWNGLAWLTGGGRAWFAAPELDAGPAMPDAIAQLMASEKSTKESGRLIYVAPQSRWSPREQGLDCVLLQGPGLKSVRRVTLPRGDPPPGLYLIPASILAGQDTFNPNAWKWFRDHPAERWIGGSLGMWEVVHGEPSGEVGGELSP